MKETIQEFVSKYTGNDLATDLANFLTLLQKVKSERTIIWRAVEEEKARHQKALDEIRKKEVRNRNECPHPQANVTYHCDAAGGSDSYNYCDLCGREF